MRSRRLALALVCLIQCSASLYSRQGAHAQFLFTYEISPEDEASRAPKSSLFDPNSFKIVTPSQLQSSYQRISSQLDSVAAAAAVAGPPSQAPDAQGAAPTSSGSVLALNAAADGSAAPLDSEQESLERSSQTSGGAAPHQHQSASLLRQTSAALQSLAELFSLTAPSSSPAPLVRGPQGLLAAADDVGLDDGSGPEEPAAEPKSDQQAEARSISDHWVRQRDRTHPHSLEAVQQQQPAAQLHSAFSEGPAMSSFTTATSQRGQSPHQSGALFPQPQQPRSTASYWITSPAGSQALRGAPGSSYLLEVKPQRPMLAHSEQLTSPATLVDNLLAMSEPLREHQHHQHHQQHQHQHQLQQQQQQQPSPDSQQNLLRQLNQPLSQPLNQQRPRLLQSSGPILVTPTSYYPAPEPQPPARTHQASAPARQAVAPSLIVPSNTHQPSTSVPKSVSNTSSPAGPHRARSVATPLFLEHLGELSAPANMPDRFVALGQPQGASLPQPVVQRSAEETLKAFRAEKRPSQEGAAYMAQPAVKVHAPTAPAHQVGGGGAGHSQGEPAELSHPKVLVMQREPQRAAAGSQLANDIPKVSPQIYESFLLQQKDQHEKHRELLKQQQELNRLLEEQAKQKEREKEKRQRNRKKEELEREAAAKKRSAAAKQAAELEARRKLKQEQAEKERREAEAAQRAAAAAEAEEERKREAARYREYLEAKERERARAEARRQAEVAERAEAEQRRRRSEDEAKLLRQQEELKKLLELKQRLEEVQAQRQKLQRQAAVANVTLTTSAPAKQTGRANRLAQELRQRIVVQNQWLAQSARLPSSTPAASSTSTTTAASTSTSTATSGSQTAELSSPRAEPAATTVESEPTGKRQRPFARIVKKLRTSGDEKLIRQKIPLYSGPGQYGLYRGAANSSAADDLAALLNSVTLPAAPANSPPTSPSSGVAAAAEPGSGSTPEPATSRTTSAAPGRSSSLSPLLRLEPTEEPMMMSLDDDVPRRPARNSGPAPLPRSTPGHDSGSGSASASSSAPAISRRALNTTSWPVQAGGPRQAHIGLASLPPDSDNDGIPGRAGVEYPTLSSVPSTSFSCAQQPLNGYYADTETACQVVHLCQGGSQSSILCPNGTIFNQEKFSCQWWYEVNCSRAPIFYQLNDNLYKSFGSAAGASGKQEAADLGAAAAAAKNKQQRQNRSQPESSNLL